MRGYTLMELLVVMVVVGVVLACSLPSLLDWRESARYRQAAREIVNALRLARSHAVTRSREVEVDFDLDDNRYRLRVGDLPYGSSNWRILSDWAALPPNVALAATKTCDKVGDGDATTLHYDTIQFNPNGSCGASGSMAAYYICILNSAKDPCFAGAILSTSTGRAVVRRWDTSSGEWR